MYIWFAIRHLGPSRRRHFVRRLWSLTDFTKALRMLALAVNESKGPLKLHLGYLEEI